MMLISEMIYFPSGCNDVCMRVCFFENRDGCV